MTNTDFAFIKHSPRNHIHNKRQHVYIDQKLLRHQLAAFKYSRNDHEDEVEHYS